MADTMKRFLAAILFTIATISAAAAQNTFVSSIVDLPLMSGLSENIGRGIVFDTPSGRIIKAYAHGTVTRSQVLNFYSSTLPQLGWSKTGKSVFSREGEILKLKFLKTVGTGKIKNLTVLFSLSPAK